MAGAATGPGTEADFAVRSESRLGQPLLPLRISLWPALDLSRRPKGRLELPRDKRALPTELMASDEWQVKGQ